MHEMEEIKRAQEQRVHEVSVKKWEKITRQFSGSLQIEFCEWFWRFFRCEINFFVKSCLTFPVNLWWFRVLVFCSAATKDCRLTHGINPDNEKTFLEINLLRLNPEINLIEFNLTTCKETGKQLQKQKGWRMDTQVKTDKIKAQFQCRHLEQGGWLRVLQYWLIFLQNCVVGQQRQEISELVSRQVSWSTVTYDLENKIQNTSHYVFWFFPSEVMLWIKEVEMVDSLDELQSSRSVRGKFFPNFEMLDAKVASALNKIIQNSYSQEEGQSRGTESPERGPVSTRKTDRLHDLRKKMLTSPLSAQKASGKHDALVVQEREVSAQLTQAGKESLRSHSSEGQKASGNPDALISSEQGNLIRSSVFRNANPSNLKGSLLEGNKDNMLNQARSEVAKQ